jgi:dienelactone hydrolase
VSQIIFVPGAWLSGWCRSYVASKHKPSFAQWRPLVAIVLMTSLIACSATDPASYRMTDARIPFTQPDGSTLQLYAQILLPSRPGRFPLAVISHGTANDAAMRAAFASPSTFYPAGAWLAEQGFAVVIPERRGYGLSEGPIADLVSCDHPDYIRAGHNEAQDIQAAIDFMRARDDVDASRVVLIGESTGGWASIAAASENLPCVVGVVAFGAGHGVNSLGQICDRPAIVAAAGKFGTTTRIPVLWIYATNDQHVGSGLSREMFDAFQASTRSPTDYIRSWNCAAGSDGHLILHACPNAWHPTVIAFLDKVARVTTIIPAKAGTQG